LVVILAYALVFKKMKTSLTDLPNEILFMIYSHSSLDELFGSFHGLRVPPPSFFRFSDLENGKSDRAEIFITDRLPEKMRHVFEEKIW
jgi:hypothetical protein